MIAPEGPPVPTDDPVGDLYPERLRERVGIEAQRPSVLPYRPEARPFELEPSRIGRRVVFAARLVEAQEQRETVAEPQEAEVSLEVLQLYFGHPLLEPALALELALAELDLLGPLGVEQEAGVVHAAKASRVRVVILYQIDPPLLGRQFQVQGIIHKGVRSILLLVPQHLPVQLAPGQVVVGDRVDRGLEGVGTSPSTGARTRPRSGRARAARRARKSQAARERSLAKLSSLAARCLWQLVSTLQPSAPLVSTPPPFVGGLSAFQLVVL